MMYPQSMPFYARPYRSYDYALVSRICCLLGSGKTPQETARIVGLEYDTKFRSFVACLKNRSSYRDLADSFNVPWPRSTTQHSEEEVREIYQLIEDGYTDDMIVDIFRKKYDYELKKSYVMSLRFRTNKSQLHIADEYVIPTQLDKMDFTDEQIHYICQRAANGVKMAQIHQEMNLGQKVGSFATFVAYLKANRIKQYQHISSLYFKPDDGLGPSIDELRPYL